MDQDLNQILHMEIKSVSDIRIDDIDKYLFSPAFISTDYPNHKYSLRDLLGTQHVIVKEEIPTSEFFDYETHVFESKELANKFLEVRCDKFVLDACSSGGLMIYQCPHGTKEKKCSAYARYYTKSHMVHVNFIHDQHDHTVGQSRFNQFDIAILRTFFKYFWRKHRSDFWNLNNIIYCMKRWFTDQKRKLEFLTLYDLNAIWEKAMPYKLLDEEFSRTAWHYAIYECEKRTTYIPYSPTVPLGVMDWEKFRGFKSEEWNDVDDNVWIERDNRHELSFNISGKAFHMAKHMLEVMDNFVRLGYAFTYSNDTFGEWDHLNDTNLTDFQEWNNFYSEGLNIVTHVEYRGFDSLFDWERKQIVDVNRKILKKFGDEEAIMLLDDTIPFVEEEWNRQRSETFRRRLPYPKKGVAVLPASSRFTSPGNPLGLREMEPIPEIVICGKYMNTENIGTFAHEEHLEEYKLDLTGDLKFFVHQHFTSEYKIFTLNTFGLRQLELPEGQQGSSVENPLADCDADDEDDFFNNGQEIENDPRIYGVPELVSDFSRCTISDPTLKPKVQSVEQYFTEIENYRQDLKEIHAPQKTATNRVQGVKKLFEKKPANIWTTFGVSCNGFVPARFYWMTGIPLKQNLKLMDSRRQEQEKQQKKKQTQTQVQRQAPKPLFERLDVGLSQHYFPYDDASSYVSSAGEYMFPSDDALEVDELPVVEPKKKTKKNKKKKNKNKNKK